MVGYATNDHTANGPEHLQHLSAGGTQLNRYNLTAVGRGVGNEDTPWDTLQDLRGEHDFQRFGEVHDEDEGVQQHKTRECCPAVANATGERTSEEYSNQGTKLARHLQCLLPLGLDDPLSIGPHIGVKYTESLLEIGQSYEVTHQEHVVGLHNLEESDLQCGGVGQTYNGAGHDKSPEGSHWVGSDSLEDCHVVFRILSLNGVGLEVGHGGLLVVHIVMADLMLNLGLEVLVGGSCHGELPPRYGCGAQMAYMNGGGCQLKYFAGKGPGEWKAPCVC